jgi:hypothetical protein
MKESTSTSRSSRKANKLGIPWDPIRANIVLLEAILHEYPSRFVEIHSSALHDAHDLLLASIVESLS